MDQNSFNIMSVAFFTFKIFPCFLRGENAGCGKKWSGHVSLVRSPLTPRSSWWFSPSPVLNNVAWRIKNTLKRKTTPKKKGSDNNTKPNSLDCSQNGSKDKELFSSLYKAVLTFSLLSDLSFPVPGFLAAFSLL